MPAPRLLYQVRAVMRLRHYSLHTERTSVDWIKRYVHFHRMQRREDLVDGEAKIEAFLTDLAVNGRVAPATQNQALNALVFLYKKVLEVTLAERIDVVRAERKSNVPVVLTREVWRGRSRAWWKPRTWGPLQCGTEFRLAEGVSLWMKGEDFAGQVTSVRQGKGGNHRVPRWPISLHEPLRRHLKAVQERHPGPWPSRRGRGLVNGRAGARGCLRRAGVGRAIGVPGAGGARGSAARLPTAASGEPERDPSSNQGGGARGVSRPVSTLMFRQWFATLRLLRSTENRVIQARLEHKEVATTPFDTHGMRRPGLGV